jgi:hypothetical protein
LYKYARSLLSRESRRSAERAVTCVGWVARPGALARTALAQMVARDRASSPTCRAVRLPRLLCAIGLPVKTRRGCCRATTDSPTTLHTSLAPPPSSPYPRLPRPDIVGSPRARAIVVTWHLGTDSTPLRARIRHSTQHRQQHPRHHRINAPAHARGVRRRN